MNPQTSRVLGTDTPGPVGVTLSGTQYSQKWSTGYSPIWAIHYEWTGTPTTAVTLWESCKPSPDEANDNDWVQDTSFVWTSPAGVAGKALQNVGNSGAKWQRLKLVTTAGAGTMSGWIHGKSSAH